jgi:hypothetical protein
MVCVPIGLSSDSREGRLILPAPKSSCEHPATTMLIASLHTSLLTMALQSCSQTIDLPQAGSVEVCA